MSSTTHQIDGWNPTHKDGDEWGMVYGIAKATLKGMIAILLVVFLFGGDFPIGC